MFRKSIRIERKGCIWTTLLLCLMMAAAGLAHPVAALVCGLLKVPNIAQNWPDTQALVMRFGLAYELIGGWYAAFLGMRILRRETKPGTPMWNLPISRGQIVLRHYLAGAACVLLMAVPVAAVCFGALAVSGLANMQDVLPLLHPALGFLALYSLLFGVAAVIRSSAFLGAAAMLLPVVALLPTCVMLLKPFGAISLPAVLAVFQPYSVHAALMSKTIVGACLVIALPLLLAIAVYDRKSLN